VRVARICGDSAVGGANREGNAVFAAGLLITLVAAALKTPVEVE